VEAVYRTVNKNKQVMVFGTTLNANTLKLKQAMACARKRGNWAFEDLEKAVKDVEEEKLSVRDAAEKYGVPTWTRVRQHPYQDDLTSQPYNGRRSWIGKSPSC